MNRDLYLGTNLYLSKMLIFTTELVINHKCTSSDLKYNQKKVYIFGPNHVYIYFFCSCLRLVGESNNLIFFYFFLK